MKKAFTLPELMIAFYILIVSMFFLTGLGIGYLSILNSAKTRYLALNVAQEGIELAIALRNKQIEKEASPWAGVDQAGTYCLSFDTSTQQINISSSINPCSTQIPGYTRLISYSDFLSPTNTDLTTTTTLATRVTSEVHFSGDKIKLSTVLTKYRSK